MILKMEKLSAFGLLSDREAVIDALMKAQCAQIRSPESLDEYEELRELTQSCTADVYTQEQSLSRYTAALSGMSFYTTKAGIFAQRPRVLYDKLEDGELLAKADDLCGKVEKTLTRISELRGQKNKDQFLKASLEPWATVDLPMELNATRTTSVSWYLLPTSIGSAELEARRSELAPASILHIAGSDKEQQYVIAVCHREHEEALWEIIKEYGAARASFPGLTGTARENIAACDTRIAQADREITELEEHLRELGKDIYPIQYACDVLTVRIQKGRVNAEMLSTRESFFFTAWVPEAARSGAVKIMEEYGCCYELQECGDEEEAPILLKNSGLVTPYESITQMYSLPAYHGFDPNGFVAPFFFLFFGMMFSDAGYGILLAVLAWILLKKMDFRPGGDKLIKVLFMAGISTVIWGAIFGSWFGDIIPVIGKVFFGKEIVIPSLLDPLADPMTVMILSFILGAIHLFVGMGIKAYLLIKRGHPWQALFDVGFWYLVLIGLPMMLMPGLSTIGMYMAIGGAVGLILTQGRDRKNPVMKLVGGVMSLYDITGYFSDVLSYSRILALGLATGVIATVVNTMGSLSGSGIVGALVLLVVFVFGHALNFAINALGSYVHTSRLQYVEFFGKFYEAGGRPFSPLAANTKYITVLDREETK